MQSHSSPPLTTSRPTRRDEDERPAIWVGYGKIVKLLRERAGLTQQQLADDVGYSCEQVRSVECGRRPAKAVFTHAAERALGAGGVLAALQDDVDRAKLPGFFQDFALLESDAVSRFSYDPLLVPGLLQTEAYARAVFAGHCPPLADDLVEQRTEARISRQRLLTQSPVVDLSFVVGEAALTNRVGDRDTMAEQLQRLADVGRLRNVELQVMPVCQGFHPGLNGPFVLLETDTHRRYGYVESQGVGRVVCDAETVSGLSLCYGKLRSQALNVDESARLIERLRGEL